MDPRPIGPEQWEQISRVLIGLVLFAGLALNGALAFLIGYAIIPSLEGTDSAHGLRIVRRVLYPIAAVSLVLTVYALGWALVTAVDLLRSIYPRFLI